jgi:hypothetical protein
MQIGEVLSGVDPRPKAPETGQIRVRTHLPDLPGKPGILIITEREGSRYPGLTNASGEALFTDLSPGEYTIHAQSDGDLPDDPKVRFAPRAAWM